MINSKVLFNFIYLYFILKFYRILQIGVLNNPVTIKIIELQSVKIEFQDKFRVDWILTLSTLSLCNLVILTVAGWFKTPICRPWNLFIFNHPVVYSINSFNFQDKQIESIPLILYYSSVVWKTVCNFCIHKFFYYLC